MLSLVMKSKSQKYHGPQYLQNKFSKNVIIKITVHEIAAANFKCRNCSNPHSQRKPLSTYFSRSLDFKIFFSSKSHAIKPSSDFLSSNKSIELWYRNCRVFFFTLYLPQSSLTPSPLPSFYPMSKEFFFSFFFSEP